MRNKTAQLEFDMVGKDLYTLIDKRNTNQPQQIAD